MLYASQHKRLTANTSYFFIVIIHYQYHVSQASARCHDHRQHRRQRRRRHRRQQRSKRVLLAEENAVKRTHGFDQAIRMDDRPIARETLCGKWNESSQTRSTGGRVHWDSVGRKAF